jgi:membrane protease YdiL (CAAX protease family)
VLPQFIAGTLFGYMRVRYGFWTAVALHALHNGTALSLALAGEALAS